MPVIRYDDGVSVFSSTFILRKVILSPWALAISSRIGATCLHGPHHSAQKSTRTGLSDLRTCASNSASVTDSMCPTMGHLSCWGRPRTGPTSWKPDSSNRTRSGNVPAPRRGGTRGRTAGSQAVASGPISRHPTGTASGARDLGFLDEDLSALEVGAGLGLRGVAHVRELGEVALRVQGSRATGAGGGDRLPLVVVDQVPGGEDARQVGPRRGVLDAHVAVVVQVHLAGEQLGARVVADGDEQPGRVELAGLAGQGVLQGERLEPFRAVDRVDLGVPDDLELGVGEGSLLHDLGGTELVAAHDHRDLGAEPGQERRLLDGRVTAPDHRDVLLTEEEAVTRGAPRDATTRQLVLAGQAELAVARPHGQDHRARRV